MSLFRSLPIVTKNVMFWLNKSQYHLKANLDQASIQLMNRARLKLAITFGLCVLTDAKHHRNGVGIDVEIFLNLRPACLILNVLPDMFDYKQKSL